MQLVSFPASTLLAATLALALFGCAVDGALTGLGTGGNQATGGTPATGGNGTDATGGAQATAGSVGSGGATGGATKGTGGISTVGGQATGGSSTGGGSAGGHGETGGTGGLATGGAEASGGADGGGGGPVPPRRSAGCGTTGSPLGTSSAPLKIANHAYYVKLPTAYDENTPYRLLYMFNPTGNPITWAESSAGYEKLSTKDNAIRVYPHKDPNNLSTSTGWDTSDVSFFAPLHEAITSNFCVDEERVFATGESSGGDFASLIGCEYGDVLRGVGPCATKVAPKTGTCKGEVTAIVIQGRMDMVVGTTYGPINRDFYAALNGCSDMTEPVEGYTDNMSNCVMFTGCKEVYPVYWCSHQDPEYSGTNHGWPKFAAKMTWEVFEAY